jgi:CreA protein
LRRLGLILGSAVLLFVVLCSVWIISRPERGTAGSVNTKFRLLGPDDKIVVDGFDDPKVESVACHIARAQTGGMKGAFGVVEDTSDASIACRQIGLIFKTLQVVRFFDRKRNVLVYVAYSDRFIEGSPKSTAHQIRLNLSPGAPLRFMLEPPSYQPHVWREDSGLVSHTAVFVDWAGPYPFHASATS